MVLAGCAGDVLDGEIGSSAAEIINGQVTSEYPATGYLSSDGYAFCTGTVIGPRKVLTAAHCIEDQRTPPYTFQFSLGLMEGMGPMFDVSEVRIHPQYSEVANDIAVLHLASDVPVAPVPLYRGLPPLNRQVTLVGYGVTNGLAQTGAGTRQTVPVTIEELREDVWVYWYRGGSACNGDSGGPAYIDDGGVLKVIGVANSVGDESCMSGGVHTRVDIFQEFIDQEPAPISVNGNVRDPSGTPLPGATVQVVENSTSTLCDAAGGFQLSLTPGSYTLSTTLTGYQPSMTACMAAAGASCQVTLQPIVAATPDPVSPTPTPGATGVASGVVYDPNTGAPVGGASISAAGVASAVSAMGTGTYQLVLPPGTYTVQAVYPGMAPGVVEGCVVVAGQNTQCPIPLGVAPTAPGGASPSTPGGSALNGGCSASSSGSQGWAVAAFVLFGLGRRRRGQP